MPVYSRVLKHNRVRQSLSRGENCPDNATMESFFGTPNPEFFYFQKFRSIDDLRAGLKDYIDHYNHDRIELKLGGPSPIEFRTKARHC